MSKNKFFLIILTCFNISLRADEGLSSELPSDVKSKLDEIYKKIPDQKIVCDVLNGYVIKQDPLGERIEGLKKLSDCIKTGGFHTIGLPKKYTYISPDGKRYTIAEKIEGSESLITKHEVKQLVRFVLYSNYGDCHCGNFRKNKDGKIYIIDTESKYISEPGLKSTPDPRKWLLLALVQSLYESSPLTNRARTYVQNKFYSNFSKRQHYFKIDYLRHLFKTSSPIEL